MELKYANLNIENETIIASLNRLTNQIYKLLPNREEGLDWEKPLSNIIEEVTGMSRLLCGRQSILLFKLLCKLEGLYALADNENYFIYRNTIFECLNIIGELITSCQA